MVFDNLLVHIIKGLILAILYFEITRSNDTTLQNIVLFVSFYVSMAYGAKVTGVDPNVITNAFLTKTVFTLVDERVKRKPEEKFQNTTR